MDYVKRVNKRAKDLLQPGETVVAVAPIQAVGTAVITAKSGTPGFGAALDAKKIAAEWKYPVPGSQAEGFPGQPCLMTLTSHRVICIETPRYGWGLKGILAEWPLGTVTGLTIEKKPVVFGAEISFSDGSIAYREAPKGGKPEVLSEALAGR